MVFGFIDSEIKNHFPTALIIVDVVIKLCNGTSHHKNIEMWPGQYRQLLSAAVAVDDVSVDRHKKC